MDGYAVRSDDVTGATHERPTVLRVVGTIRAGDAAGRALRAGEAMRIMTGAPIPSGADGVIRVEDTDAGDTVVTVRSNRDVGGSGRGGGGCNIRPRGEDVAEGALAVGRGTQLHPAHLGLLASVGRGEVSVHRRPRVAILASGDELVDVDRFDEVLAGRRIVSSNSHAIAAAVRDAGGIPVPLGLAGDDPAVLRERIMGAPAFDLLVTTGGVSVGAYDFTREVMERLGATQQIRRVRIRPGAPFGFGILQQRPWVGLPGNPVSALVTFELFARPAIRKMAGQTQPFRKPSPVRVAEAITIHAALTHFLRAVVVDDGGALVATLTGPQGSGLLSSMSRANALLVIPADRPRVEAGEVVDALMLRDDTHHTAAHSIRDG